MEQVIKLKSGDVKMLIEQQAFLMAAIKQLISPSDKLNDNYTDKKTKTKAGKHFYLMPRSKIDSGSI